jgi:hypothetical protein
MVSHHFFRNFWRSKIAGRAKLRSAAACWNDRVWFTTTAHRPPDLFNLSHLTILVGFGRIYSDKHPSLVTLLAFFDEPKSQKPNVYAESVASFGKFHVSKPVTSPPNTSRTTTSAVPRSKISRDNHHP